MSAEVMGFGVSKAHPRPLGSSRDLSSDLSDSDTCVCNDYSGVQLRQSECGGQMQGTEAMWVSIIPELPE